MDVAVGVVELPVDDAKVGGLCIVGPRRLDAAIAVERAFFLAELGDKTMLATITLATTQRHGGHLARFDVCAWSPPTPWRS